MARSRQIDRPALTLRSGRRAGTFHVVRKTDPRVIITGPLTHSEARRWLAAYHRLPATEARREIEFRTRRDPAEPGEFERHQRMPAQYVNFRVRDGEVIAIFPHIKKSQEEPH